MLAAGNCAAPSWGFRGGVARAGLGVGRTWPGIGGRDEGSGELSYGYGGDPGAEGGQAAGGESRGGGRSGGRALWLLAETSCRRNSSGARTGSAIREAKARLEAGQRVADDARGRKPGQKRNPKGGRPYKREYGAGREGAEQLHRSGEPDHEDEFGGVPAKLQRADGGGGGEPASGGGRGDGQRERPGPADPDGRRGGGDVRRDAGAGAGGRGLLQREGPAGAEGAGQDGYVALGREGGTAAAVDADEHPAKARMAEKLESKMAGGGTHAESGWRRRRSAGS